MAIRDIVTIGFGNGTFSPGVNKIPTLGYSIGAAVAVVVPDQPGIEWDTDESRLHYHTGASRLHFDTDDSRLHWGVDH